MQHYLNRAFLWDFIIVMIIGGVLLYSRPYLCEILDIPTVQNIDKIGASLISIGATLIGFLLTIITVIVTFKKGFDDNKVVESTVNDDKVENYSIPPVDTVFGKKVRKEEQFYGTEMHKKVTKVFISATYEVGFVIFILLVLQFDLIDLSTLIKSILTLQCLVLIFLSTLRSINIFKSYLNVHVGN